MYTKKILVDLDGVLNTYGKEKFDENYIPDIKQGAKEFLEKLSDKYELVLFTTRKIELAQNWLKKEQLEHYHLLPEQILKDLKR